MVPAYGPEYPVLMEAPATDGDLVLEYVMRGANWVGLGATLGAVPAFAGVAWVSRRSAIAEAWSRALARFSRAARWLVLGALGVVALLVAIRVLTSTAPLARDSIFRSLRGDDLVFA